MNISFNDLIANYSICKKEQNRLDNIKSNIINEFSNRLSQYIVNNKYYKINDFGNNIKLIEIDIEEDIINNMKILGIINICLNLGIDIYFNYNNENKLIGTIDNSKLDLLYKKD